MGDCHNMSKHDDPKSTREDEFDYAPSVQELSSDEEDSPVTDESGPEFPLRKYLDKDGHLSDEVPHDAVIRRLFYHKGSKRPRS